MADFSKPRFDRRWCDRCEAATRQRGVKVEASFLAPSGFPCPGMQLIEYTCMRCRPFPAPSPQGEKP